MDRLGVVGEEVQDAPALLDVGLGIGAQAVHQVHELDAVPDEEHLLGRILLIIVLCACYHLLRAGLHCCICALVHSTAQCWIYCYTTAC